MTIVREQDTARQIPQILPAGPTAPEPLARALGVPVTCPVACHRGGRGEQRLSLRRTLGRTIRAFVVLVLAAGAALAVFLVRGSGQPVVLPNPTGPYAVGRVSYDWVDPWRAETFAPREAGARASKREIMVWLWYPATPGPDAPTGAYLPGHWGKVLERVRGPFLWQRFDSIRVHAVPEAPVSTAQPSYPVLIFSTGYGRLPTDYTVLAEDLASHGYVVAGIANTYSAPVVVFPDGRVVKRIREAALPEVGEAVALRGDVVLYHRLGHQDDAAAGPALPQADAQLSLLAAQRPLADPARPGRAGGPGRDGRSGVRPGLARVRGRGRGSRGRPGRERSWSVATCSGHRSPTACSSWKSVPSS